MTEKLVRDNILNIINEEEVKPDFRIANKSEMKNLLMAKLREEISEFGIAIDKGKADAVFEELADVGQVLKSGGITNPLISEIAEARRKEKLQDKGGFEKRIVIDFFRS